MIFISQQEILVETVENGWVRLLLRKQQESSFFRIVVFNVGTDIQDTEGNIILTFHLELNAVWLLQI